MGKIALLPEQLINQIAAGEVVERPASVVKELLENSIDAGASRIVITVRQGGIGLIKICDDGCGMSAEDALMSLERHATSKIRTLEDLNSIQSMGFRGEALASIASVSQLTLRSKQQSDPSGTELTAVGGKILKKAPVGMSEGTEIEIAELFFNTPARLKFLKSEQTEYQNILDTVINAAMAFPGIAFKFIQQRTENEQEGAGMEEKVVLDLPATNDLLLRIRGVLGKSIADDLIEIYNGAVNLGIRGYIGKPQLSRANRSLQYLFVNGRPITSHVLSYAVKQAYHSLLPKERYPAFVIMFELDPSMVDVNCHPRKTEVKFRDEREIFRVLTQSCAKALEKAVMMPKMGQDNFNYYQERPIGGLPETPAATGIPATEKAVTDVLQFQALGRTETVQVGLDRTGRQSTWEEMITAPPPFKNQIHNQTQEQAQETFAPPLEEPELLPLGQLNNSFILCQRGADLVIIDQHAAHERIRYNKLMSESDNDEKTIQPLLMPINIELSPADSAILDANKEVLDEVGIKLEHFGGNTFAINEVPSFLVKTNLEKVLTGLIDDLRNIGNASDGHNPGELQAHRGDLYGRKEKVLTYLACRSAVKFGDPLNKEEIVALIDQLNNTKLGRTTCPHGRPVMVVLEESELWNRFGRKYSGFFEKEKFRDVNC
jgi:DNA mismatch repair protein MutL